MNPTNEPVAVVAISETLLNFRGQAHAVTRRGDRTSSAIRAACLQFPGCRVTQVRKWVAKACTGTGGGMNGSRGGSCDG